jgi:hypothetical protein
MIAETALGITFTWSAGGTEGLGKRNRLSLARKARCNAEPGKPNLSCRAVYQDVRRLYILMDEAALMELAQSHGDSTGQAQEVSHLHGGAQQ